MKKISLLLLVFAFSSNVVKSQCKEVNSARSKLSADKTDEALVLLNDADKLITDENKSEIESKCLANFYFAYAVAHLKKAIEEMDEAPKVMNIDKSTMYFTEFYKLENAPKSLIDEANAQYEQLATVNLNTAADLYNGKNYKTALKYTQKAIDIYYQLKKTKNILSAKYNAALSCIALEKYELAIDYLNELIVNNYDDNNALHYRLKAEALSNLSKNDLATIVLDTAISKYPEDLDLKFQQLNILMQENKNQKALSVITKILEKVTNRPDLWVVQAQLLQANGEVNSAKISYQKALDLDPKNEYALYGVGIYYIGEANKLIEMINKGVDAEGKKVDVPEMQIKVNAHYDKAIFYLKKVLEVNPKDASSIETLSNVYKSIGNEDKSLEYANKLKNL